MVIRNKQIVFFQIKTTARSSGMSDFIYGLKKGDGMQEYLQQVQVLQQKMLSGKMSVEEYTAKVQELAAKNFGN